MQTHPARALLGLLMVLGALVVTTVDAGRGVGGWSGMRYSLLGFVESLKNKR